MKLQFPFFRVVGKDYISRIEIFLQKTRNLKKKQECITGRSLPYGGWEGVSVQEGLCPGGVSVQGGLPDREPPCVKTLLRVVKTKMAM